MSVPSFQGLPLADRDRKWDGAAAEKRVRSWAKATEEPNEDYHNAHVWYDAAKKGNFTADQLLIADVVKGELLVVPRDHGCGCGDAGLAWWCQPPRAGHRAGRQPPRALRRQVGRRPGMSEAPGISEPAARRLCARAATAEESVAWA